MIQELLNKLFGSKKHKSRDLPIGMIYAQCSNGGIGFENRMPWRIKSDFNMFWSLVDRCPVIVGHNTYQGIGNLLRNHKCYPAIIDRDGQFKNVKDVVNNLDYFENQFGFYHDRIWVVGGAKTYAEALPYCNVVVATQVDGLFNCDSFLPWVGKPDGFVFYDSFELITGINEPHAVVHFYVRKSCIKHADVELAKMGIQR